MNKFRGEKNITSKQNKKYEIKNDFNTNFVLLNPSN